MYILWMVPTYPLMAKMWEWKWLIESNIQSIPKPLIHKMVKTCKGCKFGQKSTHTSGRVRSFRQYMEHQKFLVIEKKEFMNNLKVTSSIGLKPIYKYSRVLPYASTVFIHVCHQGTKSLKKNLDDNLHTDKQWQCSIANHIGYKFAVKVICLDDTEQDIEIFVNTNHTSHELESKGDVFFLPLYQSEKDICAKMLSNLNNI